jgi:FkbM family methyltransferase
LEMKRILQFLSFRFLALRFWVSGHITPFQFFSQLIPYKFRPKCDTHAMLFGKPLFLPHGNIRDFMGLVDDIIFKNQYCIDLIRDGHTVIDAGANIGIFSVFVAATRPHSKVYAFEPTLETFEGLKQSAQYYPNLFVFNCALGEKEGRSSLIVNPEKPGNNHLGSGGVPVQVKTIDSLHLNVDFIKIDAEGSEAEILKGGEKTITAYKPIVAMSAYHRPNDKLDLPILLNSITPYDCQLHHGSDEDFICRPKDADFPFSKGNVGCPQHPQDIDTYSLTT